MPPDEMMLEILSLYEQGWEPPEIAQILSLQPHEVQCILDADADEFPDSPLRSNRVLH